MSIRQLNKSVKIIDGEILQITKSFAERNLSKPCLKFADYSNDKYYEWEMSSSAYAVMFELPVEFGMDCMTIQSYLPVFCGDYIKAAGLNSTNLISTYKKNLTKKVKFSD